jgi:23S rRNA (uracil1939-C5)-methyltransferase
VRLEVEALAGGGRGVARADGRVVFVAGGLPGELVEARVERERAGIVEARATSVLRASPWREPEPCPVAERCGGCDLAHLRRDAAASALRDVITGALRHAPPALADAAGRAPVSLSPMGWRLRARLRWQPATGRLGFLGPRSHEVVEIDCCRVVSPTLLGALPGLAGALAAARAPAGQLVWLEALEGGRAVAGWLGPGQPPGAGPAPLAGWHRLDRDGRTRGGWGEEGIAIDLPRPLWVPVGAFFQGNRHLVARLFERVAALAAASGCRRVVDLYGGVGFFAAAARHGGCAEVIVVEAQAVAAAAARRNLPDATVVGTTAERFLADPGPAAGTWALVDPPRQGLSAVAREALVAWAPDVVLLLSCDAARFGRDAAALLAAGYALETLEVWDLFAGSHHAELLALFRR